MRILDNGAVVASTSTSLGMQRAELKRVRSARSRKPHGTVLVTGPTGSGKSTTLYAALERDQRRRAQHHHDRGPGRVTGSPGIKQMQIAPKAGVTFATGLRSMLRADPDVIMVGEIRDRETADIAVEAALTGHLVLSTLHTRDAPSALDAPDRHGHRAVPGLLGDRLHRRPAARAHALPALQAPA